MTKDPILPGEELLNELMELNQENERPLPPEQLIRTFLGIDWDSDEVCVAMELYEEIVAKSLPRLVKSMPLSIDMRMPLPKGRQRKWRTMSGSKPPLLTLSYNNGSER